MTRPKQLDRVGAVHPRRPAGIDADFDAFKALFFGTPPSGRFAEQSTKPNALNAKALAFRYGIIVHNLSGRQHDLRLRRDRG